MESQENSQTLETQNSEIMGTIICPEFPKEVPVCPPPAIQGPRGS